MRIPSFSTFAVYLVFAAAAITSLVRNEVFQGTTNVINWDGYGYYAYLPGAFVFGDITDYAFAEAHFEQYEISNEIYQLMDTDEGGRFPIYNIGLAVVWAPAFLLTHALVSLTNLAPADGMSYPYQLSVVLMSLLIFWLGLRYLQRFLAFHFSTEVVGLTLLGVGLATNLFYYFVEAPDMTHAYLFAAYACFLYLLTKSTKVPSQEAKKYWVYCGLLAGLMCLVRSSEIVVFALPALYGLKDWASLKYNFRRVISILAIAMAVFSLQLIYYKVGTGHWWQNGYAGLGFDWLNPHLFEGLLGYRRGWLIYTPLMAFALFGIARLEKDWLLAVLVFTLGNCYLLFSWHIWWYGDTFGSRPVVQSYAVLALPLAAFLAWVLGTSKKKEEGAAAGAVEEPSKVKDQRDQDISELKRTRLRLGWYVPVAVILCFLMGLNLFQHWQYNQRILPLDFVNSTYYFHVFGKTALNPKDRVFLDTNEKRPGANWVATPLLSLDTLVLVPPKASREFTNLLEHRLSAEEIANDPWLECTLSFSYFGDSYDKWKFPSIVTEVRRGEETLKWVQVKVPPLLETPTLDSVRFSVSLPEARAGDLVKQYVWNLCQDSMVIHAGQFQLLRPIR